MHRRGAGLGLILICVAGCVPEHRLNTGCVWEHHGAVRFLDLSRASDRRHLVGDLIVAEELAVRYADRRAAPPRAPVREACMAQLLPRIADAHGLGLEDLSRARGERDRLWDASLWALIGAGYVGAAALLLAWLRTRFEPGGVRLAVIALFALPAALVGVVGGEFISLVAEGVRVSNLGHLAGFRGERIPWRHHRAELLATAVVVFWCVAVVTRWQPLERRRI